MVILQLWQLVSSIIIEEVAEAKTESIGKVVNEVVLSPDTAAIRYVMAEGIQ